VLQARNIGDVAAVQAMDASGQEMRLRAWVQCRERSQGGDCFARVDILRAPKGRFNALVALVDSHNLVQDRPTQEWQAAYMNHQQQVGRQQMDQLRRNADVMVLMAISFVYFLWWAWRWQTKQAAGRKLSIVRNQPN
jgi:hypothetical protein